MLRPEALQHLAEPMKCRAFITTRRYPALRLGNTSCNHGWKVFPAEQTNHPGWCQIIEMASNQLQRTADHPGDHYETLADHQSTNHTRDGTSVLSTDPYHHEVPAPHSSLPPPSSASSYSAQAYAKQTLNNTTKNSTTVSQAYSIPETSSGAVYATLTPSMESDLQAIDDRLRQPTSSERLAQGILSMGDQTEVAAAALRDQDRKKRNKVSRACDECRRRKIRCDATPEAPDEACTTCRKTGALCQFNRPPLKRGPNKGYITQLTDRVSSLEHQLAPNTVMASTPYPQSDRQDFLSSPVSEGSRKRKHSNEGFILGTDRTVNVAAQTPSGFLPNDVRRNVPSSEGSHETACYAQARFSDSHNDSPWRHEMLGKDESQSAHLSYETEAAYVDLSSVEWDEGVVDEYGEYYFVVHIWYTDDGRYYRLIHPTYPLLPNSKLRLRQRLAICPNNIHHAFLGALHCLIGTCPLSRLHPSPNAMYCIKRNSEIVGQCQWEPATEQPFAVNLMYIQTLILMTLESQNRGPGKLGGKLGPPTTEWLGRAIGMAAHLKLNLFVPCGGNEVVDTDEELGRRIWWILFIFDKWHASSTSSPPLLSEAIVSLLPQDRVSFGDSTYHLARV